jgi:hypothetical protein
MYKPPCLRELLAVPVYRTYFRQVPSRPTSVPLRNPWQVWAFNSESERWGSRLCTAYRDAYAFTRELYQQPKYEDICVVSRSHIYDLPPQLKGLWDPYRFDWCGRCRRPTIFRNMLNHRALKDAPVLTREEPFRCYYCGARRVLAGRDLK